MKNKTGKASNVTSMITWAIVGIVGMVILLQVVANLIPTAQTAGNSINATAGLPLKSLFASNGVIFVIVMAGVLLSLVFYFMNKLKHK